MVDETLETTNPFSDEIMVEPLPKKLKMPTFTHYVGSSNPKDHLDEFT